ncbi:hypothetical protein BX600DRAFT_443418 [Xylariales sp. PMI_506]|nr:hypothetical protein BX600DRAFT_443418 [Xylariales sp. PMI_506]
MCIRPGAFMHRAPPSGRDLHRSGCYTGRYSGSSRCAPSMDMGSVNIGAVPGQPQDLNSPSTQRELTSGITLSGSGVDHPAAADAATPTPWSSEPRVYSPASQVTHIPYVSIQRGFADMTAILRMIHGEWIPPIRADRHSVTLERVTTDETAEHYSPLQRWYQSSMRSESWHPVGEIRSGIGLPQGQINFTRQVPTPTQRAEVDGG